MLWVVSTTSSIEVTSSLRSRLSRKLSFQFRCRSFLPSPNADMSTSATPASSQKRKSTASSSSSNKKVQVSFDPSASSSSGPLLGSFTLPPSSLLSLLLAPAHAFSVPSSLLYSYSQLPLHPSPFERPLQALPRSQDGRGETLRGAVDPSRWRDQRSRVLLYKQRQRA